MLLDSYQFEIVIPFNRWSKFTWLININLVSYTQPFRIEIKQMYFLYSSYFTMDCFRFEIATSKAMQKKKKKLQSCAIRISMFLRPNSIVDGSFVFCEFLPFPLFFHSMDIGGRVSLASLKIYRTHTHAFIEFLAQNILLWKCVGRVSKRNRKLWLWDEKFYSIMIRPFYARNIP